MARIKTVTEKLAAYVNTPAEEKREHQLLTFINKNIYNEYMQSNFSGNEEIARTREILKAKARESYLIYQQFPFLNEKGLDIFYTKLKPLIAAAVEVGGTNSDIFVNKVIRDRKGLISKAIVAAYSKQGMGIEAGIKAIADSKIHKKNKEYVENVFTGLSIFFGHMETMISKASVDPHNSKRKVIVAGSLKSALNAWNIAKSGKDLTASDLKSMIAGYYEFLVEEAIIQVLNDKKIMNEFKKNIKGSIILGASTALTGGEGTKGDVTTYIKLQVKKELEKFNKLVFGVSVKSTNFFGQGKTRRSPVVNFGKVPINIIRADDMALPNKVARNNWYMLSNLYYITQSEKVLERVEYASKVLASHFIVEALGLDKDVIFIVIGKDLIKGYQFIDAAAEGFFDFHLGKFVSNFNKNKLKRTQFLAPMDDVTKSVDINMRDSIRGKYKNPNFYTNYIISKINHNLIYVLAERKQNTVLNVSEIMGSRSGLIGI